MAKSTTPKKQTFEQALTQLEKIVAAVEAGEIGLEESIQQYEAGMKLIKHCRAILDEAEKRIETINQDTLAQTPSDPPPENNPS